MLPAPLPLDKQLCFTLYSTALAVSRLYKPILDGFGVTYPQFLVISVLCEKGDHTVGAIAERLDLESSTITPLVKRLEAAGLAGRKRNPDDERQVVVAVTEAGRKLHHDAKCLSETLLLKSGLTPPDLIRMNEEMQALRDALSGN